MKVSETDNDALISRADAVQTVEAKAAEYRVESAKLAPDEFPNFWAARARALDHVVDALAALPAAITACNGMPCTSPEHNHLPVPTAEATSARAAAEVVKALRLKLWLEDWADDLIIERVVAEVLSRHCATTPAPLIQSIIEDWASDNSDAIDDLDALCKIADLLNVEVKDRTPAPADLTDAENYILRAYHLGVCFTSPADSANSKCVSCGHDFKAIVSGGYDCRARPYSDAGDPTICGCDNDFHSVTPAPADKWLPIETCPDDTSVLFWHGDVQIGRMQHDVECIDGERRNYFWGLGGFEDTDPTHWMPLPAAPADSDEDELIRMLKLRKELDPDAPDMIVLPAVGEHPFKDTETVGLCDTCHDTAAGHGFASVFGAPADSFANIIRDWAKELADPVPYDTDASGQSFPRPLKIPDLEIQYLINRLEDAAAPADNNAAVNIINQRLREIANYKSKNYLHVKRELANLVDMIPAAPADSVGEPKCVKCGDSLLHAIQQGANEKLAFTICDDGFRYWVNDSKFCAKCAEPLHEHPVSQSDALPKEKD